MGVPYIQEDCDLAASDNLIIYVHHIKGQKMFGALEDYKSQSFYEKHKVIQFDTLTEYAEYEIITVFKTVAYSSAGYRYYGFVNAQDESSFTAYVDKCKEGVKTAAKASVKATQKAAQAARTTVKATATAMKAAIKATISAVRAIIAGTKALISAIIAGGWIAVFIILIVVLFGALFSIVEESSNSSYTPVSAEVQAYEPMIQKYAKQHGIPEYVELIKAVMMQESGGRGNDPMQASECGYNTRYPNTPNGITGPEYSINVGNQNLAAA